MDVPLESLRNNITTFFRQVLETAATRSCWWYGLRLDASDPDSLAQLCGITGIELESMYDACGFLLPGKFNRDALVNFAAGVPTCDVTEGKPSSFKKKHLFLRVGTGVTKGVASQYQKGSVLDRPSSTTRSLKSRQKRLQESIVEWILLKDERKDDALELHSTVPASTPVPQDTPPPQQQLFAGADARYEFLVRFIKPEALMSTDLWKDDVSKTLWLQLKSLQQWKGKRMS
jgi:hypothetical protein